MENIERKCTKAKFSSEKFALEHIRRIHKLSKHEKLPVDAYLCKNCGCWHLTSSKSSAYNENELLRAEIEELKAEIHKLRNSKKTPEAKLSDSNDKLKKTIEEHEQTIKQLRNSVNELLAQKLNTYTREKVIEIIGNVLKATGKDIKATMVNMQTNPYIQFDGDDLDKWIEKNV